MQSVALIDAYIASQDSKYAYWTARPNQFDPTITTVFPTPNFPSYPSDAALFNAATAGVLGHLFARDAQYFKELVDQAGESRIWAGIHVRSDIEGVRTVAKGTPTSSSPA